MTITRILGAAVLVAATVAAAPAGRDAGQPSGGAAGQAGAAPSGPLRAGQPSLRLGRVRLRPCAKRPLTYCGHMPVPLDYSSAASPRHPHRLPLAARHRARGRHGPGRGGRSRVRDDRNAERLPGDDGAAEAGPGTCCWSTFAVPATRAGELPGPRARRAQAVRAAVQPAGRRLRAAAEPHLALPRRRLGARLRPVQHRLLGPGRVRGAAGAAPGPGRTCTATPTEAGSRRSSRPVTRGSCGR